MSRLWVGTLAVSNVVEERRLVRLIFFSLTLNTAELKHETWMFVYHFDTALPFVGVCSCGWRL